jgi:CheY-like chemotaxis protein
MLTAGTLTIQTANVTITEAESRDRGLEPGRFVMLAVADTGVGMDAEIQAHIFEPFFTTKEASDGTGLGLATVLGIVEQSGGVIRCESQPGRGTTFRIFLPAVAEAVDAGPQTPEGLAMAPKGSETVLLAEDEEVVRKLARRTLETCGYTVLEARNGRDGLALCETHQGPIHLLVTDVAMPGMRARELAEGALKMRPGMKVLLMSGHTQDVTIEEGVERGSAFLQKPFTPTALARKVREVLDSGAPADV